MRPPARSYAPEDLRAGMRAEFERDVTEADVLAFAESSGDWNPLHVDAAYAATTRFQQRIAHGAFQVGLASALIGMHLPGQCVLLGGVQARFLSPLRFPCRVLVRGELVSWSAEARRGSVRVVVTDAARTMPTAEIYMSVAVHDQRDAARDESTWWTAPAAATHRPVVLVTGAAGGLGAAIAARLARDHYVLAGTRASSLPEALAADPQVHALRVELGAPDWSAPLEAALETTGGALYAVVHAAWPGAASGGLLAADDEGIEEQLRFGTTHTVRLARLLMSRVGPGGGRLVVVGSILGTRKPTLGLAPYSLGKAALESTVRLLAPEMARKKIAVTAIGPGFVAAGMNKHLGEQWARSKTAAVPLGRLCEPDDVSALVAFLLSPGGAFISGETIALSGGQL